MKKFYVALIAVLTMLPSGLTAQTQTNLPEEIKDVLFAACECIDSSFANFQPDFKAFLTSPDILLDDAEERYEALLRGLPQEDQKWILKDMDRIDNGEIDDAIESCVYHRFSEDYIDNLDMDFDEDDDVLLKFLDENNCHLYYLLL